MPGAPGLDNSLRPFKYSCSVVKPAAGKCWICAEPLPKKRRKYCSDACSDVYAQNHAWNWARFAVLRRDGWRCTKCGSEAKSTNGKYWGLEVNHIVPREGKAMTAGCHHHLSNLETLCHFCHVKVTNRQASDRRERFSRMLPRV